MKLKNKDVLGMAELTAEEISSILDTAVEMKKIVLSDSKKVHTAREKRF